VPIDNLVLITGAGASRELGGAQQFLPLMTDWAAILRKALDQEELGLSALVGIHEGQTGPEFEQAVGDFLAWHQILPLAARYLPFGLDRAARLQGDVRDWDQRASSRASKVVGVLHRTLYEQFGGGRINPEAAKTSYGALLGALEFSSGRTITVATTNYDPGAEVAFAELGLPPDVGEAAGPGGHRVLRPAGLCDRARHGVVPVLHLHGAVGWWTQPDGTVRILPPGTPYGDYDGAPTVLLPDPQKKPALVPAVRDLWEQFEVALSQATHVLLVGHSLHDPVLIDQVQRHGRRTAVGVYAPPGGPPDPTEQWSRMQAQLPSSTLVPMRFGPHFWVDEAPLRLWLAA